MLFTVMLAAALASPVEQRIVAAVDRHNDAGLALLERVVNINSGTMNLAGVRKVGDLFRAELDALGFATRWIDGAPFNRAGHLVAEHRGPATRDAGTCMTCHKVDNCNACHQAHQKGSPPAHQFLTQKGSEGGD